MRPLQIYIVIAIGIIFAQTVFAQPEPSTKKAPENHSPVPGAHTPTGSSTDEVTPPKLIKDIRAQYPDSALTARVGARIVIKLVIGISGNVDSAQIVDTLVTAEDGAIQSGDIHQFGKAALAAAHKLEFNAARLKEQPVKVEINYTFHFKLPTPDSVQKSTKDAENRTAKPTQSRSANFVGRLVERGTRASLAGMVVTVYRRSQGEDVTAFEATSDISGRFKFYNLTPGTWQVRVAPDGYYRFETSEIVKAKQLIQTSYYIERKSYNPYDVLVEAARPHKEVTRRTLTSAEIATVPGTLGDPILVVENLPGVARASTGSGELIVRGSGPEDTGVFVDGINVPLIYHFGGLKSILPNNVLDSIDFYPGNFSVQYGRALGGVLDAHIKRIAPDRHHGSVDIGTLDTSLYLEFPLGDNAAIAVAGRRSYIDFILDAVIPSDSNIGLINAPRYYDYQILGNWRPKSSHDFRVLFFGSDDKFKLLFKDPTDDIGIGVSSGNASADTQFQRLTAEYRYVPNKSFQNRLKLAVGRDAFELDLFGDLTVDVTQWQFQARDTATLRLNKHVQLNAGVDALLLSLDGDVNAPIDPTEGETESDFDPDDFVATSFNNKRGLSIAPFLEAELTLGPLRLVPGLRLDYYSVAKTITFDPRFVARYEVGDWALKAGAGIVHQEAPIEQAEKNLGNPDLEVQRGIQYSVGAEWRPLDHLSIDATLFYKDLNNLIASTNDLVLRDGQMVRKNFDNSGSGRVYGAEVFLRHQFANNFRGWLSYTLSRARRRDRGSSQSRPFDHDQTHIFAAVGSYRLPRNWEIGLRWRLVTGGPTTPVIGSIFDNTKDAYLPILGETNTDRLSTFHQLDLRVDKTWVFRTWQLSAYLSVINTYNRRNVEDIEYNFDFSEKGGVAGLPIVPIFGVKGKW